MKGMKLYEAINEIDDDLIEEAKAKPTITVWRKYAAGVAAAVLALTVGVVEAIGIVKLPKLSEFSSGSPVEEATDVTGVTGSAASMQITEAPTDTQLPTEAQHQATTAPEKTQPQTTTISSDDMPIVHNFSGYSLDYWMNSDKVCWGTETVKGAPGSGKLPPGTVKISSELSGIINGENDDNVYAVLVDFEPCINKKEMDNWEYNGDTIAGLTAERNKLYVDNGDNFDSSDSEGEHNEPAYDISDIEKYNELTERIAEVWTAYYNMKLQEFKATFIKNGMDIYSDPWAEKVLCFYTFGVHSQLENFVCNESEAFILYPAQRFK